MRFGWVTLTAIVSAVVAVIATVTLQHPLDELLHDTRTVAEQIDAIEHQAAAHGAYVQVREADLRGPGLRSLIVNSSDTRFVTDSYAPRSDRLVIYDVVGVGDRARLVKRWSFSPRPAFNGSLPWLFELQSIQDIRGDGEVDITGSLRTRNGAHPLDVPILIRWDPGRLRYTITPLINVRPSLAPAPPSDWASTYQLLDRHRVVITDIGSGLSIAGYSAQFFGVVGTKFGAEAVIAYPSRGNKLFPRPRYELVAYELDFGRLGNPVFQSYGGCSGKRVFERAAPADLSPTALLSAWRRLSAAC